MHAGLAAIVVIPSIAGDDVGQARKQRNKTTLIKLNAIRRHHQATWRVAPAPQNSRWIKREENNCYYPPLSLVRILLIYTYIQGSRDTGKVDSCPIDVTDAAISFSASK